MRRAALLGAVLLCGCGSYADFTLPPVPGQSRPGVWRFQARPAPVLGPGDWDSRDVLNPSVVGGPPYLNLYSGFDGRAWHTGMAESEDGVTWRRRGRILSPDAQTWEDGYIAANGSALREGAELYYWYHSGPRMTPRIGLARSADGATWRKETAPVLAPGPRGSWDERGVADPYVIRAAGYFYMYYLGQDRAYRQRIGVARSRDGVRWQKLRTAPLLELGEVGAFDERGLGEPAVWGSDGAYWMLYTGRDRQESRRLGMAQSRDGVHWTKRPEVFSGAQPWNAKVICDATMLPQANSMRVWFGGGDRAAPDENLNGQIGEGVLRFEPGADSAP